jgi:hypothetical protein
MVIVLLQKGDIYNNIKNILQYYHSYHMTKVFDCW